MKLLLPAAIAAVTVIGIATAILAYYNWNQKLAGQLISVLVVGTSTAFVTVLLSLREVSDKRSFTTSFAVDSADGLPPKIQGPEFSTRMMLRADDLGRSAHRPRPVNGRPESPGVPAPDEGAETYNYLSELLQYQIASDIREMQIGSNAALPVQMRLGVRVVTSRLRRPSQFASIRRVQGSTWNAAIRTSRFWNVDHDAIWDEINLPVPEGVQLELASTRPADSVFRDHIIKLSHRGYFEFTIIIHADGASTEGTIPDGLIIEDAVARRCDTYHFTITMLLDIENSVQAASSRKPINHGYVSWPIPSRLGGQMPRTHHCRSGAT